jgi:hypothetical protein
MGIQVIGGGSGVVAGVAAEAQKALHVNVKPDDVGSLGQYMAHGVTGSVAAGAGALSEIVQVRYTGANLSLVYSIVLESFVATTAFVAGSYLFDVIRAAPWGTDGTGGATQVPEKLRTSFAAPTTTFRIATTAALGAGTKTLATQPLRAIRGNVSTGVAVAGGETEIGGMTSAAIQVGYPGPVALYPSPFAPDQMVYPITLAQNEGVVVRATVPATGVWVASFTVRFAEVTAY